MSVSTDHTTPLARCARGAALLALVLVTSGCATGTYLRDRGLDLLDPLRFSLSAGPELSIDVQATDLLHVMVGGGQHVEAGMHGRRFGAGSFLHLGLPVVPFLEGGVLYGRSLFTETRGAWRAEDVADECYLVHSFGFAPTNPDPSWIHALDVEVGFTVLVGARAGFSVGELLDFLLGLVTIDIADDDHGLRGHGGDDRDEPVESDWIT